MFNQNEYVETPVLNYAHEMKFNFSHLFSFSSVTQVNQLKIKKSFFNLKKRKRMKTNQIYNKKGNHKLFRNWLFDFPVLRSSERSLVEKQSGRLVDSSKHTFIYNLNSAFIL